MAERAPKTIAVLSTGRQDYGILRSTLLAMSRDPRFRLELWVGGMHLSRAFGYTVERVEQDGLPITARLDFLGANPEPVADSSRVVAQVGAAVASRRPDALLLLGDRSETAAAGLAATLVGLPIVHLHGGEETEGAIDNALRHALTKLSHLHLVSHADHARRVIQMGEPAESVVIVGAAGLDNLYRDDLPTRAELAAQLGLTLDGPLVVVTQHATTLASGDARDASRREAEALAGAMAQVPATYVITQPNADLGGDAIRAVWMSFAAGRSRVAVVEALGERGYWGMLRIADAVLGNSSSGLLEAPAAGLPVVNVGDRQRGRLRSAHVIDVAPEPAAVAAALTNALRSETRARLAQVPALYPHGAAAPRILDALAAWEIPRPARKRFHDLDWTPVPPTGSTGGRS